MPAPSTDSDGTAISIDMRGRNGVIDAVKPEEVLWQEEEA